MDPRTFHGKGDVVAKGRKDQIYGISNGQYYNIPNFPLAATQHSRSKKRTPVEQCDHFIAIVQEEDGSFSVRSSQSLKPARGVHLQNSLPLLQEVLQGVSPSDSEQFPVQSTHTESAIYTGQQANTISFPFRVKRRRVDSDTETVKAGQNGLQRHRQPSVSTNGESKQGKKFVESQPPPDRRLVEIRLDETEKWEKFFVDAFRAIQQTACRTIAKEWIRAIHPKKQSTHPYNGNMPRHERRSPERTKPPYWPRHVRHKEPDHIDKEARTSLLVHLIMRTPQPELGPGGQETGRVFTAQDLLKVLEMKGKQEEGVADKWELIREVCSARSALENYAEGGYDPDTVITVPDWSDYSRKSGRSRKKSGRNDQATEPDDVKAEDGDDTDDGDEVTSPSPSEESPEDEDNEAAAHDLKIDTKFVGQFTNNSTSSDEMYRQSSQQHQTSPDYVSHGGRFGGFPQRMDMLQNPNFSHPSWQPGLSQHPQMNGQTSYHQDMILIQSPVNVVDPTQYDDHNIVHMQARPTLMHGMLSNSGSNATYGQNQSLQCDMNGLPPSFQAQHMSEPQHLGVDHRHHHMNEPPDPTLTAGYMNSAGFYGI